MGAFTAVLVTALALGASGSAEEPDAVAVVLGEPIARGELAGARDESERIERLLALLWARVAAHYVREHGLAATESELAELAAYDREFRRKDRAQRARKLAEIERRLAREVLDAPERERLEDFRATLRRLARYDAERDREPPSDESERARFAAVIEAWKLNRALYERYGGAVELTAFGPAPHGARAALFADYEARGLIRFLEPGLAARVHARLGTRPSTVVPPERVDFTPLWKLPIPPSYFPD